MVVLCDAPTQNAQAGFDEFLREFKSFHERGQIKVLEYGSLEECYPDFDGWNRTAEQVSEMTGKQKKQLAKRVGDLITKEQFEHEMEMVFSALDCTWNKAF